VTVDQQVSCDYRVVIDSPIPIDIITNFISGYQLIDIIFALPIIDFYQLKMQGGNYSNDCVPIGKKT